MNASQTQLLERARRAFAAGDWEQTVVTCRELLDRGRRNVEALYMMGFTLAARQRYDDAAVHLERCVALEKRNPRFHFALAKVDVQRGRYDAALRHLDAVRKLGADSAETLRCRAQLFDRRGEAAKVRALAEPAIAGGSADGRLALYLARAREREGREDDALDLARRFIDAPATGPADRSHLGYFVGQILERRGDLDGAFAAYAAANEPAPAYDCDAYRRRVDAIVEVFDAARLARSPRAGHGLDQPVLVVGMPRTGSTLVEQIIDAHPNACAVGESFAMPDVLDALPLTAGSGRPYPECMEDLDADGVDRAGRTYVETLRRQGRATARRLVDKRLVNYEHLGLAALIVPQARVIDCRRDPVDTCVSCYASPLVPGGHPYASSLEHLGRRYREYERLMTHWRSTLDLAMLAVRYEDLVADPEGVIRRIIDFLALPWDDRCLRYHESRRDALTLSREQVRRPVYASSVGRGARFAAHLDALRRGLGGDGARKGPGG